MEIVEVVLRFMEHLQRSMKKNGGSHSPPSQHSMIPIEALRVRSKQETLNPRGDEEKARDSAFMRGEGKKKREQVNIKQEEERGKKSNKTQLGVQLREGAAGPQVSPAVGHFTAPPAD